MFVAVIIIFCVADTMSESMLWAVMVETVEAIGATEASVKGPKKETVPKLFLVEVTKASVAGPKKDTVLDGVAEASVVWPKKEVVVVGVREASVI